MSPRTYRVAIRKNLTGEVRVREMDTFWEAHSLFLWKQGSYSCDCYREAEFRRAGGEPEVEALICGFDRFFVPYVDLSDGSRIEIDRDR